VNGCWTNWKTIRFQGSAEYFPNLSAGAACGIVISHVNRRNEVDGNAAFSFDATTTASGKLHEVLVLGLGNILLGDDGVGVHVVRRLATEPALPPGLQPLDGGTMGFRLMDVFAKSDAILLVDAVQLGGRAGTIRLLETDELNRHVRRGGRVSAHEAGLVDLLTLARLEGCTPARVALLGIEPQSIDWDEALSPPVTDALPAACRLAIKTVLQWQLAA
jgi:hydrogenase maturation protease